MRQWCEVGCRQTSDKGNVMTADAFDIATGDDALAIANSTISGTGQRSRKDPARGRCGDSVRAQSCREAVAVAGQRQGTRMGGGVNVLVARHTICHHEINGAILMQVEGWGKMQRIDIFWLFLQPHQVSQRPPTCPIPTNTQRPWSPSQKLSTYLIQKATCSTAWLD